MQSCNPIHLCWYCKVHGMIANSDPRDKSLLRYFAALPRAALDRLYTNGWAVQGVLRALPSMARLYALRLVMPSALGNGLPTSVVNEWPMPTKDARLKHDQAIGALKRLNLLEVFAEGEGGESKTRLRKDFAMQLFDVMRCGGVLADEDNDAADGVAVAAANGAAAAADGGGSSSTVVVTRAAVTTEVLAKHARARWEKVLQAILTPPRTPVPLKMDAGGATLQDLFVEALLLEVVSDGDGDADGEGGGDAPEGGEKRLVMSRDAARFLLLPTSQQVWRVVRAYMELAELGTPGTRHDTLCFLMRLGMLEIGRAYRIDDKSLDGGQRATLEDMARFGLAYRPVDDKNSYYATPLAQHLLSGANAAGSFGAGASTASAAVAEADPTAVRAASDIATQSAASGGGFVVLETNYRLYGYTRSQLWSSILGLFMRVEILLPNLIIGTLTRESIHRAIDKGISAGEIAAFLERNAHARMLARQGEDGGPIMPDSVINQVHLWAKERHRLHFNHAQLYEGFSSLDEFSAIEKYAKDTGALLWSRRGADGHKCSIAVHAAAHQDMKQFVKRHRANNPAGGAAGGSSREASGQ